MPSPSEKPEQDPVASLPVRSTPNVDDKANVSLQVHLQADLLRTHVRFLAEKAKRFEQAAFAMEARQEVRHGNKIKSHLRNIRFMLRCKYTYRMDERYTVLEEGGCLGMYSQEAREHFVKGRGMGKLRFAAGMEKERVKVWKELEL